MPSPEHTFSDRYTAIYLRVSTEEQAREGVSIPMQKDLCEKYVEMHELGEPVFFIDEGRSATTLERTALTSLRGLISEGAVKHVVVFKLDRLTRKVGDLCDLIGEFEQYDVALHGVRDKLDTSTASGRLVLHIMGAVAEWERDTIADRTKSGLAHIRSQGWHIGAPPFGWEVVNHDGPGSLLTPTHDYPLIQKGRSLREEGHALASIGQILRGQRHPQAGKRIVDAPLVSEMQAVTDGTGAILGYKHRIT
jgi:DNA invertase Pin-like site-specific DNA recombinase